MGIKTSCECGKQLGYFGRHVGWLRSLASFESACWTCIGTQRYRMVSTFSSHGHVWHLTVSSHHPILATLKSGAQKVGRREQQRRWRICLVWRCCCDTWEEFILQLRQAISHHKSCWICLAYGILIYFGFSTNLGWFKFWLIFLTGLKPPTSDIFRFR